MTAETVKVDWPKTVGLICNRALVPKKVLEDPALRGNSQEVAYELGFSKEQMLWTRTDISHQDQPQELVVLKHIYRCPIHGAYYLPKVVARPLLGKMMPKGILHVHIDGELLMEGWLSDFLPDVEPVDCSKLSGWKKTELNFRAHVMIDGGADGKHQIGFMMPNLTKLEVRLSDVTTEEKMTLEIGILSAYYSTKKSEVEKL